MTFAEIRAAFDAKMTAIADKIRGYTKKTTVLGLDDMPDGVESVYKAGKKAEYDLFWDTFQQNGALTNYNYAFFGKMWTDDNFKPKYDIKLTGQSNQVFRASGITEAGYNSMVERSIGFDSSGATSMLYCFAEGVAREIPFDISFEGCTVTDGAFGWSNYLQTIKKIILKADGSTPLANNMFSSTPSLENVTFEGMIGRSLNMLSCTKLSVASMKNIIEHLADYAGTDNELAYKLTFAEGCWTRLEADSTAPDGGTWRDYVFGLGWNT